MIKKNNRSAFEQALFVLEKSTKTKKQLQDYLASRGYSQAEIDSAFEKLEEYHFIDDKRFGEHFVEINCRTKGKRRLQYELESKGVDEELIQHAVENLDNESEAERAFALIEKRFSKGYDRAKIYRFLAYRGFDGDVIRQASEKLACRLKEEGGLMQEGDFFDELADGSFDESINDSFGEPFFDTANESFNEYAGGSLKTSCGYSVDKSVSKPSKKKSAYSFGRSVSKSSDKPFVKPSDNSCSEDFNESAENSCLEGFYVQKGYTDGNSLGKHCLDNEAGEQDNPSEDFESLVERAYSLAERRYRGDIDRNKIWRFLAYRKFSGDVIKAVIKRLSEVDDYEGYEE